MLPKSLREVVENFKSIGYKAYQPKVEFIETYSHSQGDGTMPPLFVSKDGKTLYIDVDAKDDLNGNDEAAKFYIGHELAHCFTKEGHEGRNFTIAIKRYNFRFEPKLVANPINEDIYNKKYLPTFYKKSLCLDNSKSHQEFTKLLKEKPWLEKGEE